MNSLYLDDEKFVVNKTKHAKAISEQHVVNSGRLEYREIHTIETVEDEGKNKRPRFGRISK